jgi:acetyl esterase/lipase
MPLHPLAKEFLDVRAAAGSRPVNELSVDEARQQAIRLIALLGPGESVQRVENRNVPGPIGEIPVRIYWPQGDGPLPVLVWFHGGGWVVGNLETTDVACRALTNAANCIVVSVNYRHAPEHQFPAPAEDAYAATQWVAENAVSLNGDSQRIAVGGSSAGGNLAAVVSLMARDRGGPRIVFQYLAVPVADYAFSTASYMDNAEGYGLTMDAMKWFWKHYLAKEADGANPYASPLRAKDLRALSPAFVATSEFDPLRDEGEAYAARLRAAGVPVVHKRYDGMIHGFAGADAVTDAARELRKAFVR